MGILIDVQQRAGQALEVDEWSVSGPCGSVRACGHVMDKRCEVKTNRLPALALTLGRGHGSRTSHV